MKMKIYAAVSTLAALVFLFLFLATILNPSHGTTPNPSGGGQSYWSPNEVFQASAITLSDDNSLAPGSREPYYEFTIARGHSAPFKRGVISPSGKTKELDTRFLGQIVFWAPDSSEVTFVVPGATLKLDVQERPQQPPQ